MADVRGARSAQPERGPRPAPVDHEPGARLAQTLLLVNEIDRTARGLRPLLRAVERLTGLAPAQVRALLALAADGGPEDGPRDAAVGTALADTGLVTAAGAGTGGAPSGSAWRLTDSGRAVVEQVQGLQIRIMGTVMASLPEDEADEILTSLRRLGDALEGMHPRLEPRPVHAAR